MDGAVLNITSDGAGPRVMIVDDNRDAAELLAEILDAAGFETLALLNAQSALASLAEFQPESILIDIGLPSVDGYELARRIRTVEEFKAIRLIAITGYGQPSDRKIALAAGFSEHLVKPVDVQQLEAILRAPKVQP
ncbi:MAG: response regulator [Candidatus Binataceae bacterium]|jgi:CheY-like chemotaxis protein